MIRIDPRVFPSRQQPCVEQFTAQGNHSCMLESEVGFPAKGMGGGVFAGEYYVCCF